MRPEEGLECCLVSHVQDSCDKHGGLVAVLYTGVHGQQARQVILKALVSGPYAAHLILIFFLICVADSLYMLAGTALPVCCMPSVH